MRYIIIGTGAAGIAAAETIRNHDPRGEITLIGEEPEGYYSRPGLAYYLTGELPESQLFPFTAQEFHSKKFNWWTETATQINPVSQLVTLGNGRTLPYDRLLLATGAAARPSDLPGGTLPGVVNLDNISDARAILHWARRAKAAVVLGGGITALEIVEGLVAQGVGRVHYFLRGDRYWSNVLDEQESKIVEHRLAAEGVELHYFTEAAEIVGKPAGLLGRGKPVVAGVRTGKGEVIPCGMVAVAIGVAPRLELAKAAGLKVEKGVVVDAGMRTSHPNIYAAGDVAQAYDAFAGKPVLDILWPVAREQGRVAGANMAGGDAVYEKDVPMNVTRLAGLTTSIIGAVGGGGRDADTVGIVRGDSETWREIPDALVSQHGFDVNRIRLMIGEKTILGAVVMGNQTLSRPIHQLIARRVDISPIRERLAAGDDVGGALAAFWGEVGSP
jgi:NADPH-dependent 2,4-dienoyl-CoA reductase/sulfur reductase-like enzyme